MHPTDFDKELRLINPDYFLEFNNIYKCWQARQRRSKFVRFAPIEIKGKRISLSALREFSVVIKSLSKDEINRKTLNFIQREEYLNNKLGAYKHTKNALNHNEQLREKEANRTREEMRYGIKQDKKQILQEKSVLITDSPLVN